MVEVYRFAYITPPRKWGNGLEKQMPSVRCCNRSGKTDLRQLTVASPTSVGSIGCSVLLFFSRCCCCCCGFCHCVLRGTRLYAQATRATAIAGGHFAPNVDRIVLVCARVCLFKSNGKMIRSMVLPALISSDAIAFSVPLWMCVCVCVYMENMFLATREKKIESEYKVHTK